MNERVDNYLLRLTPFTKETLNLLHNFCTISVTCYDKNLGFCFFVLLSVQYALHLYEYFKEWRKNPHFSFSCCLALLLPLNDFQGEIRGLIGKNVLRTQLQTGNFEMITLRESLKDSGAFVVTLEEGEKGDDHDLDLHDDNRPNAKISNKKCHQETQTEFLSLPTVPDLTVHHPIEERHL